MIGLAYREGHLLLDTGPEPKPTEGCTLIDVIASGVCGTDIGAFRHGRPLPDEAVIMGHEILGRVSGSHRRVVVNPIVGCGTCVACSRGITQRCAQRRVIGFHSDGGFAPRVAVPSSNVFDVPPDMSDDRALFTEPLATALHAWRLAAPQEGARIAVMGAGAIGLSMALVAASQGMPVEECVDLDLGRLRLAEQAGVHRVSTALQGSQFDVVFDCVGAGATRHAAVEALTPGGTCVLIGLADATAEIDAASVVAREKTLRGAFAYTPTDFCDASTLSVSVPDGWVKVVTLRESVPLVMGIDSPPEGVVKIAVAPE